MFITKVNRPNAGAGTQVENSLDLRIRKIWGGETELVVESEKE
jgi:hypothetical protein